MVYRVFLATICAGAALLPVSGSATEVESSAPRLITETGMDGVAFEAFRMRILTQRLSYVMEVDASGQPTSCEINRDFRRKYVGIALCRELMKHHEFEPARDAQGNAVAGRFDGLIDFQMLFNPDGTSSRSLWSARK